MHARTREYEYVPRKPNHAILALVAAGALWGFTVPLSKLALASFAPAWLAVLRFAIAAPLLALGARGQLRHALAPEVALSGALGFGGVVALQNAGIQHTSVSHAAVVVGAVPVLVALIAATRGARPGASAWSGYALALAGVALLVGSGGRGASAGGDLLVLGSALLSALFIVLQPRVLAGRDPAAVTAVQLAAGALTTAPVALIAGEPLPAIPSLAPLVLLGSLAVAGTLLPFWLFAAGQARVPAQLAGAFVNLEPVVGAVVGWLGFGETPSEIQLAGAAAVLAGIVLTLAAARAHPRLREGQAEPSTGSLHGGSPRTVYRPCGLRLTSPRSRSRCIARVTDGRAAPTISPSTSWVSR